MALLPDRGTDIKGSMKSYDELLRASGYSAQPDQFRAMLRILDQNLRLISTTDPMGHSPEEATNLSGMRFYQLTHDFLVPAIRERLTAQQRSTRRGRAELLLRDLSASWNDERTDRRSLPGWFEWLQIQLLTNRPRWTKHQRDVMSRTSWSLAIKLAAIMAVAGLTGFAIYASNRKSEATALVTQLSTAKTQEVAAILENLSATRSWAAPELKAIMTATGTDPRTRTFVSLALLPIDPQQNTFLAEQLLTCPFEDQPLLLDALNPIQTEIVPGLWATAIHQTAGADQRFRAVLALARFDPPTAATTSSWQKLAKFITTELVEAATYNRDSYPIILSSVRPLNSLLAPMLSEIVCDRYGEPVQQSAASQLLMGLLKERPAELGQAFLAADLQHVQRILPIMDERRTAVIPVLRTAALSGYEDTLSKEQWTVRARQQSMAAALLLRYREPSGVWTVLQQTLQPDARTYLIHLVEPMGVDPALLLAHLRKESDDGIRNALLLALGEYDKDRFDDNDRGSVVALARDWHAEDPEIAIRSAAEWALHQWEPADLTRTTPISLPALSNWRLDEKTGLVMATIKPQRTELPPFEISTTEVSCRLVKSVRPDYYWEPEHAESDECAAFSLSWFDAVEFCQQQTLAAGIDEKELCYTEVSESDRFRLKPEYQSLGGYRLPTPEELRFAMLGDAQTDYDFGNDQEFLHLYEWVSFSALTPSRVGGQKKPNRFGLFDTNGNVSEWCTGLHYPDGRRIVYGAGRNTKLDYIAEDPTGYGEIIAEVRGRAFGFRIAHSLNSKQPTNSDLKESQNGAR